jgi:membrane fusion protein (multidrug efflux system)
MNKHWKAVLALVLLAVVGLGAYWYQTYGLPGVGSKPSSLAADTSPSKPTTTGFAMPVEATKVAVQPARRSTIAVGTFRSFESVIIKPEVSGRITEFNFKEGEKVKAGTVLVRLDDTLERATLAQAKAQLDLAKSNFDRAQTLLARNAGTAKALAEARSQLQTSQSSVDLAQARLEKMSLVAPFDGRLGLRKVSIGAYLAPGSEIVNLEQIDPLKIDFRVPEIFLPAIKVGAKIAVRADAFPGRTFEGEIYAIDPLVDEAGRSIVMRARIANPDDVLRPGLFARIDVALDVRPDAMFVPEQAIVPVGDDAYVFKVIDDKAVLAKVQLGMRRTGQVEVLDGLKDGDLVVTGGLLKIKDGSSVTVVPSETRTDIAPRTGAAPASPTSPPAKTN